MVTFTPKKTHDFERDVARAYTLQSKEYFEKGQAIKVDILFGMPIPKTVTKKRRNDMINGVERHTKKSDLDNLVKAVLDGLNGVAYEDDAQIVMIAARKFYSVNPHIEIRIRPDTNGGKNEK